MSPPSESPPAPKPPQFSLRALLLLITLLAVLLALANILSPMVMAGLVFLLLSIFAHVAGNALGTRLRNMGSRPHEQQQGLPIHLPVAGQHGTPRCAPRTELSHRRSLGWPIVVVTAAGIVSGGVGGGLWTANLMRDHLTVIGVAVGSIACGVLGGLAAFLAFSFAQVGLGALWQALAGGSTSTDDARR